MNYSKAFGDIIFKDMWLRSKDENPNIWEIVQSIIPNEIIKEIESSNYGLYRVMVKSGGGIDFYMIDIHNNIVALKGLWVQTHGSHLKLRDNGKEGLISLRQIGIPVTRYECDVIIPCDYSRIIDCLDMHGLVRVIKDGKWGIIDQFNQIVVPIEYVHLSPIYPLEDGQYKVIARRSAGEYEFNLLIKKNYSIRIGNNDVPKLRGNVILTLSSKD